MTAIGDKAAYVRRAARRHRGGDHTCHWPGCERKVPPAMWGCRTHWYKLPAELRSKIWRSFRPGQEASKTPSSEYIEAAREVQDWIVAHHGPIPEQGHLL